MLYMLSKAVDFLVFYDFCDRATLNGCSFLFYKFPTFFTSRVDKTKNRGILVVTKGGYKMNKFLKQLSNDKFKIGNQRNEKGLIPMKLFLSFLTVEVSKNSDCLGSSNGWTQHRGNNNLIISGGIVRGCEYLDSIKYKKNLDNVYNDFVNPFYIFDIMNDDGKEFFLKYHADNIQAEIGKAKANATIAGRKYRQACADRVDLVDFWAELQGYIK